MLKWPKATAPPIPIRKNLLTISNLFAVLTVFLVAWQLISFTDFALYLSAFLGDSMENKLWGVATFVILLEIFSLPFLLQFKLSPLARLCSAACVLLVPVAWSVITLGRNETTLVGYVIADFVFILWAAISFWELGGLKALTIKLK